MALSKQQLRNLGKTTVTRAREDGPTREQQLDPEVRRRVEGRQSIVQQGREERSFERDTGSMERNSERIRSDFSALTEGRPEEVRDWKTIAEATIQLAQSDDEQARETRNALLNAYGDQLRPHIEAAAGDDWWDRNFEEIEVEDDSFLGWKSKLQAATPLFDFLDQWGQDALTAVAGVESALDTSDELSAGEGIANAVRSGARALDITRALPGTDGLSGMLQGRSGVLVGENGEQLSIDRDGDGSINLREAVGLDPEGGGRVAGAFDLLGSIMLDPTTFATLGQSSMAKVGMEVAEEAAERLANEGLQGISRATAREMNQRIRRAGFNSLEEGEQRLYQSLLRTGSEMAAEGRGRTTTRLGRDLVEEQLGAIRRGGRDGLRLGGATVLPGSVPGRRVEEFARVVKGGDEAAGEVSRRLDEIIDGIPESQWGDAVDGLDDFARESLDEVLSTGVREGLLDPVMRRLEPLLSKLKPRVRVNAVLGREVGDQVGELISATRAEAQNATTDTLLRIGGDLHKNDILKEALSEVGDKDELFRQLDGALSNGARFDELATEAGPAVGRLLVALDKARTDIYAATLRGQGYGREEIAAMAKNPELLPDNMHDINTYMPRVLSGIARRNTDLLQDIRNLGDGADSLVTRVGDEAVAENYMKARSLTQADSIFDANNEVGAVLREAGVDAPEQLFETNPIAAMATRAQSAFRTASEVELLDGLTELRGPRNTQLAYRFTPEDLAERKLGDLLPNGVKPHEFRKVRLESGVVYHVQRDVAKELENVRRVFGDPKELNAARDLYDSMNNAWAMSATVGLVNPGFHIRNMVGNWFNMVLGGVRNPAVFGQSADLLRVNSRIRAHMQESGASFADAARYLDVSPEDLRILEGARRTGVLGDSRTLDLSRAEGGRARQAPTEIGLGTRLNPLSPDALINRKGIQLGETIEGHSRLALYIDQINKGATPNIASQHVKRHLFDYGDLTRFENEALRRVSRFYTFTRKNTALQFYALTRYPGRVANAEEILATAVGGVMDPLTDPEAEGAVPDWMPNALTGSINGQNVALAIDSPFASAEELASLGTMWLYEEDPLSTGESRGERFWAGIDALFSGVGVSGADFMQENVTGRDSFTGRPLTDDQVRDHFLFRMGEVISPALSRAERLGSQLGADLRGEASEDAERDGALIALNFLGGLQVAELSDDATGSQRSVLISQLDDLLSEQREKHGTYDPDSNPDGWMTLGQLREAAEIGTKDRLMSAIMYSWTETPDGELVWDESLRDERILGIVPKDVLDALGVDTEGHRYQGVGDRPELGEEDTEGQLRRDEQDLADAIEAFERWRGTPLTDDEKVRFLVSSPWAPSNTMLEGLGIEPYRDRNRFLPGEEEPSYAVQLADAERALSRLGDTIGLDQGTMAQYRPRLSDFQRVLNEAAAAGVPMEQLHTYITSAKDEGGGGVLSRNDRAFMNQLLGFERDEGPVPLSTTRRPDVTAEDARKIREKAWQAREEYILFSQTFGLPRPSQEQIEVYVMNSIMTSGSLDDMGITDLKGAPNREDIRTDAERLADSQTVFQAGRLGLRD